MSNTVFDFPMVKEITDSIKEHFPGIPVTRFTGEFDWNDVDNPTIVLGALFSSNKADNVPHYLVVTYIVDTFDVLDDLWFAQNGFERSTVMARNDKKIIMSEYTKDIAVIVPKTLGDD